MKRHLFSLPVKKWMGRLPYFLALISILFPFATVKSCSGDNETTYSGFEILGREQVGFLVLAIIGVAFFLLLLSFRRSRPIGIAGYRISLIGTLAACAVVLLFLVPLFGFLFDTFIPGPGFILMAISWGLVYFFCLYRGLRFLLFLKKKKKLPGPPKGVPEILNGVVMAAYFILAAVFTVIEGQKESFSSLMTMILPQVMVLIPVLLSSFFIQYLLRSSPRRGIPLIIVNVLFLISIVLIGVTEIFYIPLGVLLLCLILV